MARQKQNTEWTQKISFFIFILHIICVSVKRLHILVTRQALLESYKKWVDKCQVYKNSAVYTR